MKKDEQSKPERQYPVFYEKTLPVALGVIAIAIAILLIVIVCVALGLFPGVR